MLSVHAPTAQPLAGGVFASVFPGSAVRPPRQKQRFERKATLSLPEIQTQLHANLRSILGIGNEQYAEVIEQLRRGGEDSLRGSSLASAFLKRRQDPFDIDDAVQTSPLWAMLTEWKAVVGIDALYKLLAKVLDDLMTEYITWSYAGVYRLHLPLHLEEWIERVFHKTVQITLQTLGHESRDHSMDDSELRKWKNIGIARLGALRVDELFDIVVDWDATSPAIEDLRHFTTNPATRSYLTHDFTSALQARLLHPGASTVEILQVYISIIRSFRSLDPRGVLLDRVARKIRRYLREREDTVKVIVTGLLSDPTTEEEPDVIHDFETLTELSVELNRNDVSDNGVDDSEFDWNDMEWVPDPVDAAADYTKSKNTDVIGSLITLFDSKEIFVKELQAVLADRLLQNKPDFNQETSVLEHLKIRFGDSALQGCEVMLRDVLDSRKLDNVVRRDQGMQDEKGAPLQDELELHAKVLSRLFWPSFQDQSFNVPQIVLEQQENYEKGFEALKKSRKLTWLNGTGQVEVELELEDRVYQGEVLPWQAAVIYAFREDSGGTASKHVNELAAELEMSPTLVRSACIFWVSKRILIETGRDVFLVSERLPDGSDAAMADEAGRTDAAAAAAEVAAAQAARESEEAERKQKMAMYHQFIVSMLTNQGAMPLPRIAMMLGIVVPGGFPFSNEELKEFLASMVKEGALDVGHGGAYKVAS